LRSLLSRSTREKLLALLLAGTLLVCHGVIGALPLHCHPAQCAGDAGFAAEHQAAAGEAGDAYEHPVGHGTSAAYFAVLVAGLLGLLLGLLPRDAQFRIRLDTAWPVILCRMPAVLRPPPTPTPRLLQVFTL
jgi:hypothetical protein